VFAALDPDMSGVLPVSTVKLALLQTGLRLLSYEAVLLCKVACVPNEPGRIQWLTLLDHLRMEHDTGISPEEWSVRDEVRALIRSLREWENIAADKVAQLEGRPAKVEDMLAFLVYKPNIVDHAALEGPRQRIRKVSVVEFEGHPVFGARTLKNMVERIVPPMRRLGRMFFSADPDLLNMLTETELRYVLKCTPGRRCNPKP
jgi:hypothetical protein